MKELRLEELSIKQKLGMVMTGRIREDSTLEDYEFTMDLIRNHSLGAIWVSASDPKIEKVMADIKAAADYPILIITDAESGIAPYKIGKQNSLGCTNDPNLAYTFGKVTATAARKLGFNTICNPILDMKNENCVCGGTMRSFGSDKYKVATLAAAEARGMHDGGVLTVAKHYPGNTNGKIDAHMAETFATTTKEELLDYNLYPYLKLMAEDLLDGIMTQHSRFINIDPDFPSSLSKKIIGIIREQGFDGFAITDALIMMGVSAKFGNRECKGLAIAGGNDLALTWGPNVEGYESICYGYNTGVINDARLDEAVTRVLAAQHKVLSLPTDSEITDEDIKNIDLIDIKSIFAKVDEGLSHSISRDGRHYFVILKDNDSTKVDVDTFSGGWYSPGRVEKALRELFPNSDTIVIKEYPSSGEIYCVLGRAVRYEDVVFVTFFDGRAYIGKESLTTRVVSTIEALQVTNSISALVHFGNPFVLEELPHIPRVIIGGVSEKSVNYGLKALAGEIKPEGVLTYDVKLP